MRRCCSLEDESGFWHRQSTSLYWRPKQTHSVDRSNSYILPKRKFKVLTYLFTYLLTYLLSPCSIVLHDKLIGLQLVKNRTVHYRLHKCPPPAPILSQIDPVHVLTLHILKVRLNIILPYTPAFSKRSFSPRKPP